MCLDGAVRRIALAIGWLAASYLGSALVAWIALHAQTPWFVLDIAAFAPVAALLIWMVRDTLWAGVIIGGLAVLAVVEHLVAPIVGSLVHPLLPPLTLPPAPRFDYLAFGIVSAVLMAAVVGLVELGFLWPYLKPWWMWPVYKVIGAPLGALSVVWPVFVHIAGVQYGGWGFLQAAVSAAGIAILWRFDATAPRRPWPQIRIRLPQEPDIDPVYAARIAELERALEQTTRA
jgi:hypothetical protein